MNYDRLQYGFVQWITIRQNDSRKNQNDKRINKMNFIRC